MGWRKPKSTAESADLEAPQRESSDPIVSKFYSEKNASRALQDATTSGDYERCGTCGGTSNVISDGRIRHCGECSGTGRVAI